MKPVERVAALYLAGGLRSFTEDLELHLLHGYVTSTPTLFMMGRAVDVYASDHLLRDPSVSFDHPNGWLMHAYAGDIRLAASCAPYPLEFCAYHRKGSLRIYPFKRFFLKSMN